MNSAPILRYVLVKVKGEWIILILWTSILFHSVSFAKETLCILSLLSLSLSTDQILLSADT